LYSPTASMSEMAEAVYESVSVPWTTMKALKLSR
jgi:hypothetical protein